MKFETEQDLESAEGRKMCFKETLKSPASPVKVIPFQLQFIIAEAEETAQPQYINYPAKAYSKNMSWLFEDKQTWTPHLECTEKAVAGMERQQPTSLSINVSSSSNVTD